MPSIVSFDYDANPAGTVNTEVPMGCCTNTTASASIRSFASFLGNSKYFTEQGGWGVSHNPQCVSPALLGFHAHMQCNNGLMSYAEGCGPCPDSTAGNGCPGWANVSNCDHCLHQIFKDAQPGNCYKASGPVFVHTQGCASPSTVDAADPDSLVTGGGSCQQCAGSGQAK